VNSSIITTHPTAQTSSFVLLALLLVLLILTQTDLSASQRTGSGLLSSLIYEYFNYLQVGSLCLQMLVTML
jgi:hypothetical protein